jgi:hypothetical protein
MPYDLSNQKADACTWMSGQGGEMAQTRIEVMRSACRLSLGQPGFVMELVADMISPLTLITSGLDY